MEKSWKADRRAMMPAKGRHRSRSLCDRGATLVEMLIVVLVIGIIAAIAIPIGTTAIKDYRLHSDATEIASYLNVARMNAASKYAPYRLIVNIGAGSFTEEQLCGNTPFAGPGGDAACNVAAPAVPAYASHGTPLFVGGTQLVGTEDTYSSCRPASITGSLYPGTIVGDPAPCPDPLYIYFNTRGSPVDNTGSPLGNGGAVLYLTNQNNLTDAITVATGGRVSVFAWSGSAWVAR